VEASSIIRPQAAIPLDVHASAALDRLTRWAAKALRAPGAFVALVGADGRLAVPGADREGDPVALCEQVVQTRAPRSSADDDPDAFVAAPLIDSTGAVLGCLCVTDSSPRRWSERDIELVSELAISATTELELRTARAMAEREKRWSDGQQTVLELIAARAPLAQTLTVLLRVSESHAPGMLTSILLLERSRRGAVLRHAAAPTLPRSFTSAIDGLAVGESQGICGTAAHRREPVVVLDVETDELTVAFVELARAHGLQAGWSTPILTSDGKVLGTFALYYRPARPPKPSDEIVIERSIHLARLAIEQNRDAAALRRSATHARALAREQTALQRVATSVAAETNPVILFARVAQQVSLLLRAECGYVLRFVDEDRYRVAGSWGRREARMVGVGEIGAQAPDGLAVELRGGRRSMRRSVAAADGRPFEYVHRIGAPIVVDGRPWGMVVAMRDRNGAFPPDDEKRIARFAQLASVAVANAHARERLAAQALTDPLTGLANRRAFDQRLAEETERALRHGRALSLMLVDVDHFKAINDRYGHAAGDRVLVNLTGDLSAAMRQGDLLARIGGDEMAMILADCPPSQAADVARRMLAAIAQDSSLSQRHGVTLSIGVASLGDGDSSDVLLRHADQALYRAKDQGRNQVVGYEQTMTEGLRVLPH